MRARCVLFAVAMAAAAVSACGSDYPSRDWSGSYLLRMTSSSSDCRGASVPPPMGQFIAEVRQDSANQATMWMNPIVRLAGTYTGDVLAAGETKSDPVTLPDSLARRVGPEDSLDFVSHTLRAEFDDWRIHASYAIRAPDVQALVRGSRPYRCTLRYELEGARFEPPALSDQPWLEGMRDTTSGATPAPAEQR